MPSTINPAIAINKITIPVQFGSFCFLTILNPTKNRNVNTAIPKMSKNSVCIKLKFILFLYPP